MLVDIGPTELLVVLLLKVVVREVTGVLLLYGPVQVKLRVWLKPVQVKLRASVPDQPGQAVVGDVVMLNVVVILVEFEYGPIELDIVVDADELDAVVIDELVVVEDWHAGFGTSSRAIAAGSGIGVSVLCSCRQFGEPFVAVLFQTIPTHGVAPPELAASQTLVHASGDGK